MKVSHSFVVVVVLFVTCLITANIMAVKLVSIAGLMLPAAIIIFPLSYIIGDILTEVYGYRMARRVIWLGFLCNLIAVIVFWIGGILPAAPIWEGQAAYELVLGYSWRLLLASFVAYLMGEFSNSIILAKMKIRTNGRFLWARTIGSTVVGQFPAYFINLIPYLFFEGWCDMNNYGGGGCILLYPEKLPVLSSEEPA